MSRRFLNGLSTITFQLTGGSPAAGKYLVSDGSGNGTWSVINKRVTNLSAGTSYTPNADTSDLVIFAAPTGNFTVNAASGTPVDGQVIIYRILTGATAYTPTWNAVYISGGATLPTTFTPSTTRNLLFVYDANLTKWVLEADDQLPAAAYIPMQVKAYRRVSTATTITATDGFISADATSAGFNVTLPSAASVAGQAFTIKKWNATSNTVTIVGTIDGATNYAMAGTTRPAITVVSNGIDWEIG